ncbi:metallophosphoesterase [Conexibacter sp. DBS9H8]|uniref:metallophosphoesterase family protein n=1 Tax=Conexibacter sp. DBS9H8 TaxID=2937801 RepID=UPI00200D2005|nr:metallophosphoesterase family protein [Conexibacter sp. DBS9H8]
MTIAIISDVHGNRPAFEAVLADIAAVGCDRVWCLGDLVGYGAEPDRCVELARTHAELCLAGNHDLAVIGALPVSEFSAWALEAALWTQRTIAPDSVAFLRSLRSSAERDGIGLFHASPRDPVWEYVLSVTQAEACLDRQTERIALIGHSHVALSFSRLDGAATVGVTHQPAETVDLAAGRWLLNPGSVGQPRDGDPRAAWLELDLDRGAAVYQRIAYDIDAAAAAILSAGLPDGLAERLRYGQ